MQVQITIQIKMKNELNDKTIFYFAIRYRLMKFHELEKNEKSIIYLFQRGHIFFQFSLNFCVL